MRMAHSDIFGAAPVLSRIGLACKAGRMAA
jgi:hypothetical protein